MKQRARGTRKLYIALFIFACAAVVTSLFRLPSSPLRAEGEVDVPTFSSDSGSYQNPFHLTLTAESGCDVYYSTDGSIPSVGDVNNRTIFKYVSPISIKDRNGEPNFLSSRENRAKYYTGEGDSMLPENPLTDEEVPKATVIRAIAVDATGASSTVMTRTYFIGDNLEPYDGYPVISLVTDPDNLLDDEYGIYVRGMGNGWGTPPFNFEQDGRDWEREADMDYFDENHEVALSSGAGIRIRGGYSRRWGQKSFNVYFREEYIRGDYGFKNIKDYPLIPDAFIADHVTPVSKYKSIVLRNGGNDTDYTKLRDLFIQSLVSDRDMGTQAGRPCILYLNGEYWGPYNIQEKYGDDYFAEEYGVTEDNIVMIKNDELSEGVDADMELYEEFRKMDDLDMSKPENYAQFCESTDVQNYIDYMATQLYIANEDWPHNNFVLWRVRNPEPGVPYGDGKWRWMLYDTEFSMGLYSGGSLTDAINRIFYDDSDNGRLFRSLAKNAEFCRQFVTTMMDLRNMNFHKDNYASKLEEMADVYRYLMLPKDGGGQYLPNYQDRWSSWGSVNFDGHVASVQDYLEGTFNQMAKSYLPRSFSKFGVAANKLKKVTLSTKEEGLNPDGSSIRLNTITPNLDGGSWTGEYFSNYPVTITANVPNGYEFSGWTVTGGTADDPSAPTTSVTFSEDVTIVANYRVAAPPSPTHVIILQAYGTGDKTDGAISHGFVELYNPTNKTVDLSGYSLQYAPGAGEWSKLDLTGQSIEPRHSFLVRCTGRVNASPRYAIPQADLDWDVEISNRSFELALVDGDDLLPAAVLSESDRTRLVDLIGVKNEGIDPLRNYEGSFILEVSKQKSARRNSFGDTDDNSVDLEAVDYRTSGISDERMAEVRPRYSGDGAWGPEYVPPATATPTPSVNPTTTPPPTSPSPTASTSPSPNTSANPSPNTSANPSPNTSANPTNPSVSPINPSANPTVAPPTTPSITPSAKPSVKVTVSKAKVKKLASKKARTLTITIKPVSGAKGYQVVCATNKKFTTGKKTASSKKATITIRKLLSKRKYYVKVRAYKLDADGKKTYGKYSVVKTKKTR